MVKKKKIRWDLFHFRLAKEKDQLRFIELFKRSGARNKTEYIRARVLCEDFKVVSVNKDNYEYLCKLDEFIAEINRIGVLYNQTVKRINSTHSLNESILLLKRVEEYSDEITRVLTQVKELTAKIEQK